MYTNMYIKHSYKHERGGERERERGRYEKNASYFNPSLISTLLLIKTMKLWIICC